MVSKIAVIALVAIVSVPILLGYAMNVNEVTITDYKTTGDSVNVTNLLRDGTAYSYAEADVYNLNTNFLQGYNSVPVLPLYQSTTKTQSNLPGYIWDFNAGVYPGEYRLNDRDYHYWENDYDADPSDGFIRVQVLDHNGNIMAQQDRMHSFYWNKLTQTISATYYPANNQALVGFQWTITDNDATVRFTPIGTYTSTGYQIRPGNNLDDYIDLSAGFKLEAPIKINDDTLMNDSILANNKAELNLPEYPSNVLITMDLNTITDSSYELIIELGGYGTFQQWVTLVKSTDSGGVHWEVYRGRPYYGLTKITDLYYDSSRLSNTYQIYFDNTGLEFRYVGNWPTVIGEANYYLSFKYERDLNYYIGGLRKISFWNDTPVMRVDQAAYRAFEYAIIENKTYNPADFKTNPATTISDVIGYGTSIVFGGITYTVKDGNITLGSHQVPVKDLVFSSVPNDLGSYDNKIGNTIVSTSANPSTIRFNGQWSASISTIAQESYTYTETEWIAGDFGWDGVDHNFLLVGLITSFAAFIGCGIYAKKSRSGGIIPVMIVCGGAALMFFLML